MNMTQKEAKRHLKKMARAFHRVAKDLQENRRALHLGGHGRCALQQVRDVANVATASMYSAVNDVTDLTGLRAKDVWAENDGAHGLEAGEVIEGYKHPEHMVMVLTLAGCVFESAAAPL